MATQRSAAAERDERGQSPRKDLAFKVEGMDCAEEVALLKSEVGPFAGGEGQLDFDLLRGKMTVREAPEGLTEKAVVEATRRAGLEARPWRDQSADADAKARRRHRWRAALTTASGVLTVAGFAAHAAQAGSVAAALGADGVGLASHRAPTLAAALYALGIACGLWHVLPRAWGAARRLRPDMNLLMTIAVAGAIGIGQWFEAATVAFLFALSLLLESWSVGRARRAIEALMTLAPTVARLKTEEGLREVSPEEVTVGSRIAVHPSERIPLDGRVVDGASQVNQAPITGESVPADKRPGDEVYAGSINGDGAIEIETTKAADDTTLAHIVKLVSEAQSRRSPSEQWVESFARWYTPLALAAAALALLVPPLAFGEPWGEWLYRALVLLVIACPCALVISTPVSVVAALAAAARNGVLVKGGVYMEAPARLRAVALDKTGTITQGRPEVQQVIPLAGHDETELLQRAAAMEARSGHPLAQAVVAYAAEKGVAYEPAESFEILPGRGARARFGGREYWLGSLRYLEERGQATPDIRQRVAQLSEAGRAVVAIGTDDHVCGLIGIADAPRPEARASLAALREAGVSRIVMLTGDNRATAEAIAAEIGIDETLAELLPQDKLEAVERLVAEEGQVAMVGDGVNDAPSLARATIGIAMGAAGSDAAIEAADIALMSEDLSKLPFLVRHARRTLAVIRQNIVFALSIKALFVVLAVSGVASLWAAIAADLGASLLVVSNGLRLLRAC